MDLVHASPDGVSLKVAGRALLPPLGILYLAANTPPHANLRIFDENALPVKIDGFVDIAGISFTTGSAAHSYELAERYRRAGAKVVLGGTHASFLPDEGLKYADSVVVGEGEKIWPSIIEDAEAGKLKPVYRQEEPIDCSEPLPPRRDLAGTHSYWALNSMQTVRGCPRECSFCSVTRFQGRRYRMREVEDVINEISRLPQKGPLGFAPVPFIDGEFGPSKKRTAELLAAMCELKVKWGAGVHVSFCDDEEIIYLARKSGCRFLILRMEDIFSDVCAREADSVETAKLYARALRLIKKHDITSIGDFHFGFDSDDAGVFERSLEFVLTNPIDLIRVNVVTPYPGTRFYESLEQEGRLEQCYWMKPGWRERVVFKPKRMTPQELLKNCRTLHNEFYSRRRIISRTGLCARTGYVIPLGFVFRRRATPGVVAKF